MIKGNIQMIVGPMFSGKSTELTKRMRNFESQKKRCAILRFVFDMRSSRGLVSTNDDGYMKEIQCVKLYDVTDQLCDVEVIGIDEGQYFPDLFKFCDQMANSGKIVIVAVLDSTCEENWNNVVELELKAESVDRLEAKCKLCGQSASFTRKISEEKNIFDALFIPTCRECFSKPLLLNFIIPTEDENNKNKKQKKKKRKKRKKRCRKKKEKKEEEEENETKKNEKLRMGEGNFDKELLLVPPLVPPSEWEINNLREVETLKKGGFGVIVLYEHKVTKKLVVVKKAQSDKDKFFAREIDFIVSDIMGNVAIRNHPNIVHIYGKVIETTLPHRKDKLPRVVGEGVPCLVMEAALYGSLERVVDLALKSGRQIPEKDICWFGLHIAEGLRVLHAENKVHRDIKTDNVLIRGDYSLCVADFGLSWRVKDGESKILAQLGGTHYYFAPESLLENIYSSRTDMWSFGVLLYRLANLDMPFESGGKDIGQVCAFIIGKKPNKFRNHYSPELEDVINSLLSKTPEERPTAEDMCAFFAKRVEMLSCGGNTARKQTLMQTQTQTQTQASTCAQTQAEGEDAQFGADTALSVLPSLYSSSSSDGHVSYDDDSTSSSIIYHLPSSSPYAHTSASASASSDTYTFVSACHTSTTPFSSPSSFLYSPTSPSTSHSAPPPFELESLKNLQPFFG